MPSEFDYTLATVMQFMVDYRTKNAVPTPKDVSALVAVCEEYNNVRSELQKIGSRLARLKRTKIFPPGSNED